uniref:Sodium-dependent phosphate transport protein 2B n=1 Tax=Arion vulgaris TaxID=1028688 RepID=A0A0B7BCE4_9EUPU
MDNKAFYDEEGKYSKETKNRKANRGYVKDSNAENGKNNVTLADKNADKEKDLVVNVEEEDPWKVTSISVSYTPWSELSQKGQVLRAIGYLVKIILIIGCLYMFICSLDFLSSAFRLLGGEAAGRVFQQSDILTNPVAGLMIGVLVTVLVQSSSTSTSIVVSMVGAGILDIRTAIPITMGANIGTSVTNTIVALGQMNDKGEFRRAFAGATVHDMFNWLTVIVLLPLELISGYLFHLTEAIVNSLPLKQEKGANKDMLKVITTPFTEKIIQVSKDAITNIAQGTGVEFEEENAIMKLCCDKKSPADCCSDKLKTFGFIRPGINYTEQDKMTVCGQVRSCVKKNTTMHTATCMDIPWLYGEQKVKVIQETLNCAAFKGSQDEQACCASRLDILQVIQEQATVCQNISSCFSSNSHSFTNVTCASSWMNITQEKRTWGETFSCSKWVRDVEDRVCFDECEYLFRGLYPKLNDKAIGGILLVISLAILCACLVCIVKLLHTLLQGPMAMIIKKFINADFPGCCGYFTGYLAILIGAGLTIVVQSSSIFTSTLTPLVGIGVIELERMYPLTLGSNIGTTTTAILSALATSSDKMKNALQVAFCHLFFNISGIILFYPIPALRFPLPLSRFLGNQTAKYRWYAIVYILAVFFLLPAIVFALSIPGWYILLAVLGPFVLIVIVVFIIKCLQEKRPQLLPTKLQDWKFLPVPLRSLEPYDKGMQKVFFCKRFKNSADAKEEMSSNTCIQKSEAVSTANTKL